MASLDYGSGGVDNFADYEWSGQHYFTYDSDVILEFNVDITAPNQALRAVNAGTVVSYVNDTMSQLFADGNSIEFRSTVGFMSQERTFFAFNPFLGESISLWDIDDLATWPDQIQLQSAVSIGDVKDYVDQNLSFAVDYVLNTTQETVANEVSSQLPEALPPILASTLPTVLDDFALNAIFPEVDRRIAEAGGGSGGTGSGLTEDDVNGILDARLPVALESYMDTNVYPFIDQRTVEIVNPLLQDVEGTLRNELTTLLNEGLEASAGLTPDEVVALIDNRLPELVNTALEATLPSAIPFYATPIIDQALDEKLPNAIAVYATPIVEDKIAEQLPNAIQEGIASSTDTILSALSNEVDQAVEAKLSTDLPIIVRNEINEQLPSAVKEHLDLTLDDVVGSYVAAIVPSEVQKELGANLRTEVLWPIVQDAAGEQADTIAQSYLNSETLWPLVADASGQLSTEIVAAALSEQFTQTNIWNYVEALSATQANGLIEAAIAEFEATTGSGLSEEDLWPLLNGRVLEAINETIAEAFPSLAQDAILENMAEVVSAELQAQLPSILPDQVGQVLASVLPEEVQDQVFTNLQIALADGGMITTAIETRVNSLANTLLTDALENTILPQIGVEVTNAAEGIIPPIVEEQVAGQLNDVLPSLVENTVQEALQPELDALVNNTIPNVVNLQMSAALPEMVNEQLDERFGQGRPSVYRRYNFDTPQQFWIVEHEFIGAPFSERLYNSSGRPMYSSVEVVNETSFVVTLTEAMTGWVDVEFYI